MNNLFNEKGEPNEQVRSAMIDFNYGLNQLITSDDVKEMTENELRMLGSHLAAVVNNAICQKIAHKLQCKSSFSSLTDEEFYIYLEEKYGSIWMLVSLTQEELDRVPQLSDQQIRQALEQGERDRKLY